MRKKITIEIEVFIPSEEGVSDEVTNKKAHDAIFAEANQFVKHDFVDLVNDNHDVLVTPVVQALKIEDVSY